MNTVEKKREVKHTSRCKLGPIPEAPKPHRFIDLSLSKLEKYCFTTILILILIFAGIYIIKPEIIGRATLQGNITTYSQNIDLQISENQEYEFQLNQHP